MRAGRSVRRLRPSVSVARNPYAQPMTEQSQTLFDRPLRFSIPSRDARGRVVRLGPVLDEIRAAHAYPPAIERILAEALVLAALFGSMLKDAGGQLTMQAQTEQGVIKLLVVDFRPVGDEGGELRGYVDFDAERLAEQGPEPTLYGLFGKGYLAITFDQKVPGPDGQSRYQGIVPLEGESLAEAAAYYFEQSEQLPTLVRVGLAEAPGGMIAGGLLVQHMPEGEEGRERLHTRLDHPEWEHVRILAETISDEELVQPALPLEEIVWRLFHEEREVRIDEGVELSRGCRCDPGHIRSVIQRFPEADRADMADDTGVITVDCAFCSKKFPIRLESLA